MYLLFSLSFKINLYYDFNVLIIVCLAIMHSREVLRYYMV